jgi:acetyltransferase-like isoleucine patch superfamily enzyme|tara:strand:- start:397 stop:894 length:498 start_codon:yes stop_codon:yes gene_type:complete
MIKFIVFKVYKWLQKKKKIKYDRYLPLNELLIDRSKKAEMLKFGKGTTIHDSSHVYGDVLVGENTWIGPFTVLDGSGGLLIGSNCSISAGVQIYTHETVNWAISGGKKPYEYNSVVIEDNCYIGPNSIIQSGIKIKSGTIVGANSFVNNNFPIGSKIAGNPAKLI